MSSMTLYLCSETGLWSHEPCNCPGRLADDETGDHSAIEVPDLGATVARLVNLIRSTFDRLGDGDEVMDRLSYTYNYITGKYI